MSPLLGAPNRGYADWQRVENWDTGLLLNVTQASGSASYSSPALDVSRSAYLSGYIGVTPGDAIVAFSWYDDANLDDILGYREYHFSSQINNVAQLRIPNMGPFCQLQVSRLGAFNYGFSALVWGTNRYHPLELIPRNVVPVAHSGAALAASATNTYYPSDYYAGPLYVNAFCGQAFQVAFDYLDATDNWTGFTIIGAAAGAFINQSLITPPGAWRVRVVNQAAQATTESLRVTPSLTGSS